MNAKISIIIIIIKIIIIIITIIITIIIIIKSVFIYHLCFVVLSILPHRDNDQRRKRGREKQK